jgi:hypothetical protein
LGQRELLEAPEYLNSDNSFNTNASITDNHRLAKIYLLRPDSETLLHPLCLNLSNLHLPASVSPIPSECNNIDIGIPTFFERPQTTAFFPKVSIPENKSL